MPPSSFSLWTKQSPRAWFGRFILIVLQFGMTRSEADHSDFYSHSSSDRCIYLVVYVDDIVIMGNDQEGIQKLKHHLFHHFQTKDLGKLKYFNRSCSISSGYHHLPAEVCLRYLRRNWHDELETRRDFDGSKCQTPT